MHTCLDYAVDERWGQSPIQEHRRKDQVVLLSILSCFVWGQGRVIRDHVFCLDINLRRLEIIWVEMFVKAVGSRYTEEARRRGVG